MVKRKQMLTTSVCVLFLMIIMAFLYLSTFLQPKIIYTAQINNVNTEDFKKLMNNNPQVIYNTKEINKFKKIHIQMKIITPLVIINHTHIESEPSQLFLLQQYLKDNDKIQILNGGNSSLGNGKEYDETMGIYLKNISEDEFKNILGDFRIKILWQDIWSNENNKILYLKDYLK